MGRFAPKRLGFGVSKYVFIRVNSLAATRRLKIFNVCSVCDRRSKVVREPFTSLVINSSRRLRRPASLSSVPVILSLVPQGHGFCCSPVLSSGSLDLVHSLLASE